MSTKISALNLIPRFHEEPAIDSIRRASELAIEVEKMGYHRYWIAEHHNFAGVVSSSTSNLIQHILSQTSRIRVGAGGVMLPNHTPLQVAETYGTLDVLYPERVDLGLGRAPGTDTETAKLIYRGDTSPEGFIDNVRQVQRYFGPEDIQESVIAIPAVNRRVPLYILGSTTNSAYIAAQLGLPYSFASHFSPNFLDEALKIYRDNFIPSDQLSQPYIIMAVIGNAQETLQDARRMSRVLEHHVVQSARGEKGTYNIPDDEYFDELTTVEKFFIKTRTGINFVGNKNTVSKQWTQLKHEYHPDEVMVVSYYPEISNLIESYQIIADIVQSN